MRTGFLITVVLLSSGWVVDALALNCENAYTRMERSICGSESLRQEYSRLQRMSDQAIDNATLTLQAAERFKDNVALTCRMADDLDRCLHREMSLTASMVSEIALARSNKRTFSLYSLEELHRQLDDAENEFVQTGDPESLVVTLISLLQRYEKMPQTRGTAVEIDALSDELMGGCEDSTSRTRWHQALQSFGRSCPLS